jgi:hypothetical protein
MAHLQFTMLGLRYGEVFDELGKVNPRNLHIYFIFLTIFCKMDAENSRPIFELFCDDVNLLLSGTIHISCL